MRSPLRSTLACLALALAVPAASGCEKTDHATIDKWKGTQKGEGKLRAAMLNSSLDADLSAHAAANLIVIGREPDVREALEGTKLSADRKAALTAKLVPRLWPMARIEGELAVPSSAQTAAKDTLFSIRKFASPEVRATIDGYLVDWYTSGYYEGRATLGAYLGAQILRAIGAPASAPMIAAANAVVAKPPTVDAQGRQSRPKIGNELLLGLAAVGSPETVKYVLNIVGMTDRGDDTLGTRAMAALHTAFVDPGGRFDVNSPEGLTANLAQLTAIAKEDDYANAIANDAVTLIRMTGKPACLAPLIELTGYPQRGQRFRYVGANSALKCGGADAFVQVANWRCRPPTSTGPRRAGRRGLVAEAAHTEPQGRDARRAARAARQRLVGRRAGSPIEGLGVLGVERGQGGHRLRGLAGDKTKLQRLLGRPVRRRAGQGAEARADPGRSAPSELADKLGA
jgi:hypothetical protein